MSKKERLVHDGNDTLDAALSRLSREQARGDREPILADSNDTLDAALSRLSREQARGDREPILASRLTTLEEVVKAAREVIENHACIHGGGCVSNYKLGPEIFPCNCGMDNLRAKFTALDSVSGEGE